MNRILIPDKQFLTFKRCVYPNNFHFSNIHVYNVRSFSQINNGSQYSSSSYHKRALSEHLTLQSKNNVLCESHSGYGAFRSLAVTPLDKPRNLNGVRHFSDAANASPVVPPQRLVLDGIWKDLSESSVVEFCQNGLLWAHETTGLPWWATIILATWTVRSVVTLPLALVQAQNLSKVIKGREEMGSLVERLKREATISVMQGKNTEKQARFLYNQKVRKHWKMIIERDNCHPLKNVILVVIQIPMWIVLSAALRNLCFMLPYPNQSAFDTYVQLSTEGFGWVTNLTLPDSYYILPIMLAVINLAIIEMQLLMNASQAKKDKKSKYLTNFFRVVTVAMAGVATLVPTGMSLYWVSSSAFGFGQNLLTMSPRLRRLIGIKTVDAEPKNPYALLYKELRMWLGVKGSAAPNNFKKLKR